MKTRYMVATFAIVMAARAQAQQTPTPSPQKPQPNLTIPEKIEIADAINLLIDDGVLVVTPDQCLEFDGDVIKEIQKPKEKLQITNAINLLVDDGVLVVNPNQCLEFDGNIISELRKLGLLEHGDSQVLTVCIGGARANQYYLPPKTSGNGKQ